MRTIWIVVGCVLLAGAIAAGSFYAGMTYQTNRANQIRASFMSARGMTDQGQNNFSPPSGAGQFQRGNAGLPGSGSMGQVKSVEGNVVTLSTAESVITVHLSDTTQIEKTVSGAIGDLQPGLRVMVVGEKDSKGNISAQRISILGEALLGASGDLPPANDSPAGTTEP